MNASKTFNPEHQLTFRPCNLNDAKLLFEWANEKLVRSNSLNKKKISWKDHLNWFLGKINSENSHIYLFSFDDSYCGQVRLDKTEDFLEIDYSVDNAFRGKGLGTMMLKRIIDLPDFLRFRAFVKGINLPSIKIFRNLGFEETIISEDDLHVFNLSK